MDVRLVSGGLLLQDADRFPDDIESVAKNWELVSGERPAEADMESLIFAWKSCRAVKSNAIVLAQASATVGIGMGQVNRVTRAVSPSSVRATAPAVRSRHPHRSSPSPTARRC